MESSTSTAVLNPKNLNGTGIHVNGFHEPGPDELERELPMVYDGQVPLGDLVSRVMQAIYAELVELAETMPGMPDATRKRTLADWVVKTKKQVVKLYAIVKWSRDADAVQKCMNITAFLMNQNQQFEDAISALKHAKTSLDSARLRNHDLLTSLDVLTTGSYRRLPSCIKKAIIAPTPLTDAEVRQVLSDTEDAIRYRLRMHENVPVEMSQHRIASGRVFFTAPKLFEASLCLRGAEKDEGWFFVTVEFLITVGGDISKTQEFPRKPNGIMKRHITNEADARLAYYMPPDESLPPEADTPPRSRLPDGTVDAPLVRLYNFLQIMSLSYQLEILWYQAQRMRSLGWADHLKIEMTNNRKTLTASYWVRPSPPTNRPTAPQNRPKLPLIGGKLSISIIENNSPPLLGGGPSRSSKARILAELQVKTKLGGLKPSDQVEGLKFEVLWEPMRGTLGAVLSSDDLVFKNGELEVDPDDLDFEALLNTVIRRHILAALKTYQLQIQHSPRRSAFTVPGAVKLVTDGVPALRVHLCTDEVVVITIEARTGKLNLRDTGDLVAARRGPRFATISNGLNENPALLMEGLASLRLNIIIDLVEQRANYLGLQSFRQRNFSREELSKLGPDARGSFYVKLSNFPDHYLVLVITDDEFRYALIKAHVLKDTMHGNMVMADLAWIDVRRICGSRGVDISVRAFEPDSPGGSKRKRQMDDEVGEPRVESSSFDLETQVLREVYAYCCARVAYMNVEQQFRLRAIPFAPVNPTGGVLTVKELGYIQSTLARTVPALCVKSQHILSGAPAAEAAMENIRVVPLNWWSNKPAQVVTCVKLKYVQQPMGKTAAGSSAIIRPSKRIIYDSTQAVVYFLSEQVDTCVDEFLEEWARVSKMVVIAREVAQMSRVHDWKDVRLLSFDLQTVEFAYAKDYTVSISCTDQLSLNGGSFDLRFSRTRDAEPEREDRFNPHDDAEPFLRGIMRHGKLASSLHRLVGLLRATLPIVIELEQVRRTNLTRVDTFAKAAGWYRVLYGDLRHALDFRLMKGERVAILDASHSFYALGKLAGSGTSSPTKVPAVGLGLQPIPKFREIVLDSVRDAFAGRTGTGRVALVDVGLVCDVEMVQAVATALHARMLKSLLKGVPTQ